MKPSRPDRGDLFVAGQVLCGAGVLWPGRPRWTLPTGMRLAAPGAVAVGSLLILAAAIRLGRGFRAHPEPSPKALLRTDGPYARVRHPIYAGVLLTAGGAAVLRARPEPLVSVAVLAGLLHLKAGYEERLLRARFGAEYEDYATRVPRYVPWTSGGARRS